MKVALVHDWLTGMRGGERVLEVIARLLPGAPLFTLIHVPGSVSKVIEDRPILTSPLQSLPGIARHYRRLPPLFPWAVSRWRLDGFDRIVSVSACVAKSAPVKKGARHICYINAPMRYAWDLTDDYFSSGIAGRCRAALARPFLAALRRWDRRTADRVDRYIANSRNIADKVNRFYGRSAEVLYPPVACDRFRPTGRAPEDFYLVLSALVPYKRIDRAVEAFRTLDLPLVIAGDGPERARLESVASSNVRFLGRVDDRTAADLLARCRALVFPGEEDFGLVPVEAQASGRPVIALGRGGVLETVRARGVGREGPTGIFFTDATPLALADAVREHAAHEGDFDVATCRAQALRFDQSVFEDHFRSLLQDEDISVGP